MIFKYNCARGLKIPENTQNVLDCKCDIVRSMQRYKKSINAVAECSVKSPHKEKLHKLPVHSSKNSEKRFLMYVVKNI